MRRLLFIALGALPLTPLAQASEIAPDFITTVIRQAVPVPGARVIVLHYSPLLPRDCTVTGAVAATLPGADGQVSLKLLGASSSGAPCEGWARVHANIAVPALVTTTAITPGAPLAGNTATVERPWRPSQHLVTELAPDAVAAESLPSGTPLELHHIRKAGPGYGDPVTVELRSGSLIISEVASLTPCTSGHDCATLPSGKHVEGELSGDHLIVELR